MDKQEVRTNKPKPSSTGWEFMPPGPEKLAAYKQAEADRRQGTRNKPKQAAAKSRDAQWKTVKASRRKRRDWWQSLSTSEQAKYISKKETTRRAKNTNKSVFAGKRENLPLGAVKIWRSADSFTVYRAFMLDDVGDPLPQWR